VGQSRFLNGKAGGTYIYYCALKSQCQWRPRNCTSIGETAYLR